MKKTVLLLIIFLAFTAFVSAQNTGITSVFNNSSAGIFENELDKAVGVGSDFTTLNRDYLFGGLANLGKFTAKGSGTPYWFGYYKAGDKPWSLFTGFNASGSTGNMAGNTAYTQGTPEIVTNGTVAVTHEWNNSATTTEFTANRLFDSISLQGQYLFMLGDINTGLYAHVNGTDASLQGSNKTVTENYYYNSAVANAVPVVEADYSKVTTDTAKDTNYTYTLGMPFFMQSGDTSHEGNIVFDIKMVDKSTTNTVAYSGTPQAVAAYENVTANNTIDKITTMGFDGTYTFSLPGMVGDNSKNQFFFGIDGGVSIEMPEASEVYTSQVVNYPGTGGAGVADGEINNDSTVYTFTNAIDFDAELSVGHSFFFDLGSMVAFGLKPNASLKFSMLNEPLVDTVVDIDRKDNDTNGDFTSVGDQIITTTGIYTNTNLNYIPSVPNSGDTTTSMVISSSLILPVAATIAPEGWPFSVTLGSESKMTLTTTMASTKTAVNSIQTVIADETGTVVSDATTNAVSSDETSTTTTVVTINEVHTVGLTMPIGENVRLDVNIDGTVNIFDFRRMVIQATIALP